MVHVEDLADLYIRALTRGESGAIFLAADASACRVKEIALAAAVAKGVTESWPLEEARQTLGAYADALILDQRVSSDRARELLGWSPRATTVLDDLRNGSYTA